MLNQFLPKHIDNTYRGHGLALWLFAFLVLMKGGIAAGTIFNGRNAAISADGIPLDTFTPAGEQAFVSLFAAWGLSQLMLNLIGLLVLVRYRAMVPFMFALLLLEHLSRKLIFLVMPIATTGTSPGFFINLVIVAVMIVGLGLSLRNQANPQPQK
ncbi:MAG TPA: hypothetical protein VEN78_30900 [Bradyrhizobium sp.]|nr:hypothetical protein [Bradyrhizobium sp.]